MNTTGRFVWNLCSCSCMVLCVHMLKLVSIQLIIVIFLWCWNIYIFHSVPFVSAIEQRFFQERIVTPDWNDASKNIYQYIWNDKIMVILPLQWHYYSGNKTDKIQQRAREWNKQKFFKTFKRFWIEAKTKWQSRTRDEQRFRQKYTH